jgi:hypothetical protein
MRTTRPIRASAVTRQRLVDLGLTIALTAAIVVSIRVAEPEPDTRSSRRRGVLARRRDRLAVAVPQALAAPRTLRIRVRPSGLLPLRLPGHLAGAPAVRGVGEGDRNRTPRSGARRGGLVHRDTGLVADYRGGATPRPRASRFAVRRGPDAQRALVGRDDSHAASPRPRAPGARGRARTIRAALAQHPSGFDRRPVEAGEVRSPTAIRT